MRFGAVVLEGSDLRQSGQNQNNNGLPAASAPTKMLGRFTAIASLSHKNLCIYLDMIRCQTIPNGVILISEHYSKQFVHEKFFANIRTSLEQKDLCTLFSVAIQISSAIEFCHRHRIVIGSITLENLLIDTNVKEPIRVKLSQFGLYHITGGNQDIDESIGSPWYFAPECLTNTRRNVDCQTDVWAFGIVLFELYSGWQLSDIWGQKQVLSVLQSIIGKAKIGGSIIDNLLSAIENACPAFGARRERLKSIYAIVDHCLKINPLDRPTASALLGLLKKAGEKASVPLSLSKHNTDDDLDEPISTMKERIYKETQMARFRYTQQTLNELYFLWKLCGSHTETILIKKGVIRIRPPVLTLPSLLVGNNQMYGNERTRDMCSVFKITELPFDNLFERLNSIPRSEFCTSFELEKVLGDHSEDDTFELNNSSQALLVKERDIEYQLKRMHLFHRLLAAYPHKADRFRVECARDIPPVYRAASWAALLGVLPFAEDQRFEHFYAIDTFSEHQADRQLQVDIPRCHQYEELMSSPVAHYRMKVLVKALLISRRDEYVYWQGLDSLSAPFLILHFNDLPTAFRCLNAFIDRYLRGFFLRDNSTVIRNYLAEFMKVLEFSDFELFTHLISLDFHPELFAIPWFLTCFAHVLPLHKLFHLWDSLLLADSHFPLFIGVAILIQLRSRLIDVNFNEAILLFSDLPDLSIDEIVQIAKVYYEEWQRTK